MLGAAVLTDSDLDRIGDRVKAMFLEARGEGGCLPCDDHEKRMRAQEKVAAKWAVLATIAALLAASLGSYFAPGMLGKSELAAPPAASVPASTGGP